jgi:PASTA domain
VNYYEVLGAPEDANQEELHQAYLAKQSQLTPERFVGAPDDVLGAVKRASVVVDQAWNVLGDVALRGNYDADLSLSSTSAAQSPRAAHEGWRRHHAEHVWAMERELGLPVTSVLGIHAPTADGTESQPREGLATPAMVPSEEWAVSSLYDPLAAAEKIADFLAPSDRADPNVTVPNVCGLRGSEVWWPAAAVDLRLSVVRLSEHPVGDGIVVDQHPPAGTKVRRRSILTIQVVWDAVDSGESPSASS